MRLGSHFPVLRVSRKAALLLRSPRSTLLGEIRRMRDRFAVPSCLVCKPG